MGGGQTLVLAMTLWLIFFPAIVTFGHPDYHQQGRRKLATDIPGSMSIDCGTTGDYYDKETGILYKSDAEFVDTGTNMQISSEFITEGIGQQQKDVRSFPQGTKNCYTLKPVQGKNQNYMIRAFFMYGNYDGKNQVPVFDLYLGVNKWSKVALTNSSQYVYYEIMHFFSTDNIHVCLVNTGFGIPFISALELRLLNSSIYKVESGGALRILKRYDVDGSNNIRYPYDTYDRIWEPLKLPDPVNFAPWYPISTQSTIDTQSSSNDAYYVPEQVLRTAARAENSSFPLSFSWGPFNATFQYYIYFHFAEIFELRDDQLRELNISLNGGYPLTEPIKLEYLKPLTVGPLNLPLNKDGKLTFSIFATRESNLPPILNAVEIFRLEMLPATPTDQEDVDAIMDIKQVYGMTRNWQGDPCVPSDYLWDGLNCSYSNPPKIISLNLASSRLTGEIASSLSKLKSIESLDLSNNELTGPVPDFLAQLPYLRTLNLTGNKLSGSIPQAVMEKVKNSSLALSVDANPNLCLSELCESKKKKKKKFVVPIVASVLVLFLLSALSMIFWHYQRKRQRGSNKEGLFKSKNQEFTYSEVVSITNSFRTIIGEGGFGKVYSGTLKNGNQVAVKVRSPSSMQGPKEFQAEAQLLMRTHHINLVSFIGYCNKGSHMVLVYEYMANGNLRQHLSETNTSVLNWQKRLQIAIDAAQGLEYLHNGCKPPIIHRDMKTANILLNERLQAKIADFGLSRDFKNEGDSHVYTDAAGTPAYIDPEYQRTGKFNKKSDVYSFGIVLMELITGHHAIIRGPKAVHIIQWVRPIIERGDIENIVDQRLHGDFSTNSAWKAVEIAMSCVPPTAIQRPDMSHVVVELKECLALEMASEGGQGMASRETRLRNAHQVELEFEMVPNAR